MKIIGTLRLLEEQGGEKQGGEERRGAVRVEDVIATDIEDLWQACTDPERLARWIAEVSGDLREGGAFEARFTSGWEGTGRVESCEPPRRLVVSTREDGETEDGVIEVRLTPEGATTILVIEERGLKADQLPAYGAGWQLHVEDLVAHLAGQQGGDLGPRWNELIPFYRELSVG